MDNEKIVQIDNNNGIILALTDKGNIYQRKMVHTTEGVAITKWEKIEGLGEEKHETYRVGTPIYD